MKSTKECTQQMWLDLDFDLDPDHDQDDALSLSDLPLIQDESSKQNEEPPLPPQTDFDFHCSPSKQTEMRIADEIFFQGQIMPTKCHHSDYPRSESLSSHHSSTSNGSSSSSSSTSTAASRNLFHSLPSPSPRIMSNERQIVLKNNCVKKSWPWSVFRLGLIAPPQPEIAFRDLKTRCPGKNSGGSEKKVKAKGWDLAGRCKKCSVDAVDVALMKRCMSGGERQRTGEAAAAMDGDEWVNHRSFDEWVKEMSVQGAAG